MSTLGNAARKESSVKPKPKDIDKLKPEERKWTDNVMRVLKLPQKGSQARLIWWSTISTLPD